MLTLIGRYEKRVLSSTAIPIVASNNNGNGFTNIYFLELTGILQGDILVMRSTVQYSGLGRNFPIFAAGRISVTTYSGDFGGNESPAHGVDISDPDHNPYSILPHMGTWVAPQNYATIWPIVWGWARSAGNEGNTVDVLNQGAFEVLHFRDMPVGSDQSAAIAALEARAATLESSVASLSATVAALPDHSAAIADLQTRVTALESAPPSQPSQPTVISVPAEGITIQFVHAT